MRLPKGWSNNVALTCESPYRGIPSEAAVRVFASRLGSEAGKLILNGEYGFMVGYKNREIVRVPLEEVAGKLKMVDPNASIVQEAKMLGISFGD